MRARSDITTSRADSSATWQSTRRCSSLGSRSTVCSVVTIGIRRSRISRTTWLPAGPPKIPYSCWRLTMSVLAKLRKSAARR